MSEFEPGSCMEKSFPDIPEACQYSCPRIVKLLDELRILDGNFTSIQDMAVADDLEEQLTQSLELLPPEIAENVDIDASVKMTRSKGAEALNQIDTLITVGRNEVRDSAEGCIGPLRVTSEDSAGRQLTAFICRSADWHEGKSVEQAIIYRHPSS